MDNNSNKERMAELNRIGQQTWENIQTVKGITHDEARKAFMQRYEKNYW